MKLRLSFRLKLNNLINCNQALWQNQTGRQRRRARNHAAQQLPLVPACAHGALPVSNRRVVARDHVLDPGDESLRPALEALQRRARELRARGLLLLGLHSLLCLFRLSLLFLGSPSLHHIIIIIFQPFLFISPLSIILDH